MVEMSLQTAQEGAPGITADALGDSSAASSVGALDVIYLVNCLSIGGSEKKTVGLVNRLSERGVRVGLVRLNAPDALLSHLQGGVPAWCLERKGKFSPAAVARLQRIIAATRPGALVAVNLYPALYAVAAVALSRAPRPLTIGLVNTSTPTVALARWRRTLYRRVLHGMDRTVHGSEATRRQWFSPGSAPWERSSVIYNGVDLEAFRPESSAAAAAELRARLRIAAASFVFGTVGRLAPEKNQRVLIDTLRRMLSAGSNVHLVIAGDGPLRNDLRHHAAVLGVAERLTLTGALSDVRPVLATLDAFVLPSIAVDSFSNAALEAMAMGKPAILSNIGGAAEMVTDGVEGFIVQPDELGARLPALLGLLYADHRRRARLGSAARARVETQFPLSAMVDAHLALIDSAARSRIHA